MRFPWFGAVFLLLVRQPGPATDAPGALLAQVRRAVDGGGAPALRDRLSRRLSSNASDREALLGLGALARLTYDYAQSDARLARVIALGAEDAFADHARMERARGLQVRGQLREAADLFAEAAAHAERRSDTQALAEALLGLAGPRSRLAPAAEVLALLERAAGLTGGDPRLDANLRCQRAAWLSRAGQRGARELAEEGAVLARRAGDMRQEGSCAQVIAQSFAAEGDIDAAARALARAMPLFERSHDRAALASLLQWRGYLFNSLGRYGEARTDLTMAISEGERSGAMSPVGWALINLGMISLGLGDRVTATEQLDRAVALLDGQGDAWGVATARSMLGGVARAAGDVPRARETYTRVLAWADGNGNALTQFNMHEALATLGEMENDWALVARHSAAAHAIARSNRMAGWEAGLSYNDGRAALRRGDLVTASKELSTYLAAADESQHATRYAARALLAEVQIRRGAVARGEAELVMATREFDGWRASLSESDMRVRAMEADLGLDPDLGVATVIAALARSGRVESAFQLAERRRARELTDGIVRAEATIAHRDASPDAPRVAGAIDLAALKSALGDGSTAVLEYVTGRGGEPTTLFVITAGGLTTRELAPIDSLAAALGRFATVLEGGGDARVIGATLGAALLQPAVDGLDPSVTRLVIVPDDILARLPFEALLLHDGRYALERYAIGSAPSVGALLAVRARPQQERPLRLLAFGDPRFVAPASAGALDDPSSATYRAAFAAVGGLTRLPESGREVRRLARYAPGADVRVGGDASEAYLRTNAIDGFRLIHFATHALVDQNAVTRSALALAPGGSHDGFVGPGDILTLTLDADLVVLSSCGTAGGVVLRGEGIRGLTAPLLQSGARAIVATGWRVDDAGATRVMEGFYRALAGGAVVVDALRAAKLEALRAGASPREWAAFVAIGDPMVRVPLVMPSAGPDARWRVLAAVALLFAFWFVLRAALRYGSRRRKRSGRASA